MNDRVMVRLPNGEEKFINIIKSKGSKYRSISIDLWKTSYDISKKALGNIRKQYYKYILDNIKTGLINRNKFFLSAFTPTYLSFDILINDYSYWIGTIRNILEKKGSLYPIRVEHDYSSFLGQEYSTNKTSFKYTTLKIEKLE